MKRSTVLILITLLLSGCIEEGNTGTVTRYARGIRGCGDGLFECQIYYIDDFGDRMTDSGLRLGQTGDYTQFYCDDYGTPGMPVGICKRVGLKSGGVTGDGGFVRIKGVPQMPGSCDGHANNNEHQAHGFWGCNTLVTSVGFSYGANPPRPQVAMWPNDGCSEFLIKSPTITTAKGPVSSNAQKALGAPTSGGAPSELSMMSMVTIDPNAIVLPDSGFDYQVYLIRTFDTYAEVEDSVNPSNVAEWEINYRSQFPCKYEYLVLFSTPQNLLGHRYTAVVKTDLFTDGIEVELEAVASNQDETVWVLLSDYFLPVDADTYTQLMADPNEQVIFDRWTPISPEEQHLYDPNMYSDPNDFPNLTIDTMEYDFMDRHDPNRVVQMYYLPCSDDDTIKILFTGGSGVFFGLAPHWLSSDETADINQDGIFDFGDFGSF